MGGAGVSWRRKSEMSRRCKMEEELHGGGEGDEEEV